MDNNQDQNHVDDNLLRSPDLPPRNALIGQVNGPPLVNHDVVSALRKNYRQITSLSAGLFILLGSGVHIVWAFWEVWSNNSWHDFAIIQTIASWYISAIFGSACGASLVTKWTKKQIYSLGTVILTISSLIFVCRYFPDFRSDYALLAGRCLAGISFGLTYLTVICHAAENAVNQLRGIILRGIGYVLSFALFIAGFTTNGTVANDVFSEVWMGCFNLVYSLLAAISIPLLTIESAAFLYRHNRYRLGDECEKLVIATMVRLRNEQQETPKIRYDLEEMKRQIEEDEYYREGICNGGNFVPLIAIYGVRVLSVCAKNLPFTVLVMGLSNSLLNPGIYSLNTLLILLTCRFFFGALTMFIIDKFEWKRYLYILAILSGAYLFLLCAYAHFMDIHIFTFRYSGIVVIIFFIFASMGIDCIGHVQTSEAFSYKDKPWSIMLTTTAEHIVHIGLIMSFKLQYITTTFMVTAVGLIFFGIATIVMVPRKTKGLSLRRTRDIYRQLKGY